MRCMRGGTLFRVRSSKTRPPRSSGRSAKKSGSGKKVRLTVPSQERPKWSVGGLTLSLRTLVAVLVVGVLVVVLLPTVLAWVDQEQAYRRVTSEVAETKKRNRELEQEIAAWDDKDFITTQARDRLGYVRPGEIQFVVVDPPEGVEDRQGEQPAERVPVKPWVWVLADSVADADTPPPPVLSGDNGKQE